MKDNKKINKTRRQRGYAWEKELVNRLNKIDCVSAVRLGGTTTTMPDILCVDNYNGTVYGIECKSGVGDNLYVPYDQVYRCKVFTSIFKRYENKKTVLAFKFGAIPKKRTKKEYFMSVGQMLGCDPGYTANVECGAIRNRETKEGQYGVSFEEMFRKQSEVIVH